MEERQPMTATANEPETVTESEEVLASEPGTESESEPETGSESETFSESDPPAEDAVALLTRELLALKELVTQRLSADPPQPVSPDGRQELAAMEEFRALFPDTASEDIPDEVWESVDRGIPLAASFALWTRREEMRRQSAAAFNRKNADGWGRAEASQSTDNLSPAEVRAMSPDQVRRNYDRILASMKHWK